jgi:molecular chaperone GrpE
MEEEEKQTKTEDLEAPKGPEDPKDSNDLKDASDTEAAEESPAEEQPVEEQPAESPPPEPDWKDRYARTMADFDNFRKRTARDREDLVKFAASDVLKDILPTVDNLARALEEAKDRADDPFVAGVKLVYDGLIKALADHGATPLDSAGEPFDANFHEALAQLPSEDVEEGHVMSEVKRGWMLNGKLLRAAQVVVSAGKKD